MSNSTIDPDSALSNSEYLTRCELLSRRSRKLRELAKMYKDQYWGLMEEMKNQYGEYCWEYGKSPFVEENDEDENNNNNVECENGNDDNRDGGEVEDGEMGMRVFGNKCEVKGCRMKAMELTRNCRVHILRDEKQVLYKGCCYVIKSSQAGPIRCNKPILRAAVPSLCTPHMQKSERCVSMALRRAGVIAHSTSKLSRQFNVIVGEYVNLIQEKRREAREVKEPYEVKKEDDIAGHIETEYIGN